MTIGTDNLSNRMLPADQADASSLPTAVKPGQANRTGGALVLLFACASPWPPAQRNCKRARGAQPKYARTHMRTTMTSEQQPAINRRRTTHTHTHERVQSIRLETATPSTMMSEEIEPSASADALTTRSGFISAAMGLSGNGARFYNSIFYRSRANLRHCHQTETTHLFVVSRRTYICCERSFVRLVC